jgi:hypothetical protein
MCDVYHVFLICYSITIISLWRSLFYVSNTFAMPWISLPQGRSLLLLQGTHRDAEEGFAVRFFTYPPREGT